MLQNFNYRGRALQGFHHNSVSQIQLRICLFVHKNNNNNDKWTNYANKLPESQPVTQDPWSTLMQRGRYTLDLDGKIQQGPNRLIVAIKKLLSMLIHAKWRINYAKSATNERCISNERFISNERCASNERCIYNERCISNERCIQNGSVEIDWCRNC